MNRIARWNATDAANKATCPSGKLAMLKIKSAQADRLKKPRNRKCEPDIKSFLSERYPRKARHFSGENLDLFIADQVSRASAYGLTQELDVRIFVELALVHGAEFDQEPWSQDILNRTHLLPKFKTQWLLEYSIFVIEKVDSVSQDRREVIEKAETRFRRAHPEFSGSTLRLSSEDSALRQEWVNGLL